MRRRRRVKMKPFPLWSCSRGQRSRCHNPNLVCVQHLSIRLSSRLKKVRSHD